MVDGSKKKLRLKEEYNHLCDTDELLWLLKGNENTTAKEFVCKYILNINPRDIMNVFEYVNE